jgi:hypothetical protein
MAIAPYSIEIRFQKRKLLKFIAIFLAFIGGGIWIISSLPSADMLLMSEPIVKNIIGGITILFGAVGLFFMGKMFFRTKPALVIDESGITIQTGAMRELKLYWKDITKVEIIYIQAGLSKHGFIGVAVSNSKEYIAAQQSTVLRKLMQFNNDKYSIISGLSANGLDISESDLFTLVNRKFTEYQIANLK